MRMGTFYRYELLNRFGVFDNTKKSTKILDIGGFDGFILSKLKASNKVLIDPNAKNEFSNIKYLRKDFFVHDFKKQKFNFILSLDVLEHISREKEAEYFSKIYSLLEKRGIAILTTPSKDIKIFPNFLRGWISRKWGHYKCYGYSKEELENLIKKAKIKKSQINTCNSRYYLNAYILIRLLQLILPNRLLEKILLKLANKDAKLNEKNSLGYYLIKIRK